MGKSLCSVDAKVISERKNKEMERCGIKSENSEGEFFLELVGQYCLGWFSQHQALWM